MEDISRKPDDQHFSFLFFPFSYTLNAYRSKYNQVTCLMRQQEKMDRTIYV